jgi:hypothetical protein
VLEFLDRAVRLEKEIKEIQLGREEINLFLFSDNMILYLKDHIDSTKKLLNLITPLEK